MGIPRCQVFIVPGGNIRLGIFTCSDELHQSAPLPDFSGMDTYGNEAPAPVEIEIHTSNCRNSLVDIAATLPDLYGRL